MTDAYAPAGYKTGQYVLTPGSPLAPPKKVEYTPNAGSEWKSVEFHGLPTTKECPVLARYREEFYIAYRPAQVGDNSAWVSISDIIPKQIKQTPIKEIDGYLYQKTYEGNIYRKKIVADPNDSEGFVIWMTKNEADEIESISEILREF